MKPSQLAVGHPPFRTQPVREPGSRRLLIATGLLVAASTVRSLRIELGGLSIPAHVIPILFALPTIVMPTFQRFPTRLRAVSVLFLAIFGFAVVRYGSDFGDLVKMITSALTLVAMALMVGKREHFVPATVALVVSLLIANVNGLRGGFVDFVGYEPLKNIGNKNAYSIYALPIVLLAGYCMLQFKMKLATRLLFGASIISSAFILFSGANRSGWGGLVLIGVLLAAQTRQWRALATVGALAAISYGALVWLGTSQTFDHRVQQTRDGYSSDDLRVSMFETAMDIGIDNPVFGVTPQELKYELARRIGGDSPVLDTHNFIGYIVGSGGFPLLIALIALGIAFFRRPIGKLSRDTINAHDLVRMIVVLFVYRGIFSREVFFVGPFPIAFGLALGLMLASQDEAATPPQSLRV